MTDENTSIVQSPRDYSDVLMLQEETALEQFLEHPLTQSLEAITGAFAVGIRKTGLAAGRVAQAIVQGKMYDQLAEEWRTLREGGKIPDNLGETKHGLYTWAELIKIIDEECPDEEHLEALKAMFYAVNKINSSDSEQKPGDKNLGTDGTLPTNPTPCSLFPCQALRRPDDPDISVQIYLPHQRFGV